MQNVCNSQSLFQEIEGSLFLAHLPEHERQHDPDGLFLYSVGHEPRSGQTSRSQVRLPFKHEHFSQPIFTTPPEF